MKIILKICLTIALCLVAVACGFQVTPTPAPVIPATPLSVASLDSRLLASINIKEHPLATETMLGNSPDEIVYTQGFLWTKTDNGYVIQVDPATNSMVSAIKTDTTSDPNHYCQGLGTDGKNIWVCSAAGDEDHKTIDVVRIDPSSRQVVATVEVGKVFNQFVMPFLADQIWVLSGTNGDKLIGIDVKTSQPSSAIELGARCLQLAAVDDALYATCYLDNLIVKIDPLKKQVMARQMLQGPGSIAAADNGVWVSQGNALSRLDPETLNPIVTFTGIGDSSIYPTETAVWIWEFARAYLYKIDPATNKVVELIQPDEPFTTGGSVLATSDSLWLTANEDYLLLRLRLE